MGSFLQNAEQILETAVQARNAEAEQWTIWISRDGAVRMADATSGWSFAGLAAEYSPSEMFRVEKREGVTQVEAWSGGQSCVLRKESGDQCWFRTPPNQFYATQVFPGAGHCIES